MASLLSLVIYLNCVRLLFGAVPEPAKYILSFPEQDNPLNISVSSSPEKNYILIIGDWGAHDSSTTDVKVQTAIAQKMISYYNEQKKNGMNLLFVGTVGDNFYYDGQTCAYYKKRWTDMYGEIATDHPWLAVMGNHDWGNDDPTAICAWGTDPFYIDPTTNIPYAAHQINADKKGCNPSNYYLPDFGYYYSIKELNFEWIALEETVTICPSDNGGQNYKSCNDSSKIGCNYLGRMRDASEQMFTKRANTSNAKNFIISQHYPQNGKRLLTSFKSKRNSDNVVYSMYGHTHEQRCDETDSKTGECASLLTGGGGGCCSGDGLRGFFVVGFDKNGNMIQPMKYNDDTISCRYPCGAELKTDEIIKSTFHHCCYASDTSDIDCSLFDLSAC